MLFTRCPDCDTTFRVTDDALKKANGQVRCGRCASVFNAYAERRDAPGEPPAEAPAPLAATTASGARALAPAPADARPAPKARDPAPEPASPTATDTRAAEAVADPLDTLNVADVVAQLEEVSIDEDADTGELAALTAVNDDAIPPAQVEAVLETEAIADWQPSREEPRRRSAWWGVGALLALTALALQAVNHYRGELVKQPAVGSLVQRSYAALGITVTPSWDVRQYEILDWIANAEPSSGGSGSLKVTARLKNHGPDYQPYPLVNLRLKNRWDNAVGSRTFAPSEYLAAPPRRLMAPGETARAQLEVVDPGPDAYGFELDVCIEVETHALSCRGDKVFVSDSAHENFSR
jgi:predicted Zn finger-like uncharacterized protein